MFKFVFVRTPRPRQFQHKPIYWNPEDDARKERDERVRQRLESGWEMTNRLLEQGVEEGLIRSVDFRVFQLVFESAVERFIMGDELEREEIDYMQALEELVTIMVDGIVVHR